MALGQHLPRRPKRRRFLEYSCLCEARAESITVDAVLRIVQGYLPGQARDCAFGGAVRCCAR